MDTITLADALAGFTSNESSALGAYIGTNGKQSAAALAKVVGGLYPIGSVSSGTLADLGQGLHVVASNTYTPEDIPSEEFANCFAVTLVYASNVKIQFLFTRNKMAFRRAWYAAYQAWTIVI